MAEIKSTADFELFRGAVRVALNGRETGNWRTKDVGAEIMKKIARVSSMAGAREVCVVWADFGAEVVSPEACTAELVEGGVTVRYGVRADGIYLKIAGTGFWLSSADCPVIIAYHEGYRDMVAAHAGLNCLIDRQLVEFGTKSRRYASIVDAICAQWGSNELRDLKVFVTCGIGPEHFPCSPEHATYGKFNTKLLAWLKRIGRQIVIDERRGTFSLHELIAQQLIELGVYPENVSHDKIDTFGDRSTDGSALWWSNARGDKVERNGVLVVLK